MSNEKNIRIVRGVSRYAGSQNKDVSLTPLINSDRRTLIQGERNRSLNLVDQFEAEREYSSTYRLYGKIDVVYNNIISGETFLNDVNYVKNMYFMPDYIGCPGGTPCLGTPPSSVFDFIPPDRYGLTATVGGYEDLTAYQDNWVTYISYVFSANTGQSMTYYSDYTGSSGMNFISSDGIPFELDVISGDTPDSQLIARLTCPVPHNLTAGQYIQLQPTPTPIGGSNIISSLDIEYTYNVAPGTSKQENVFKIDFLGSEVTNSEKYVANINLVGQALNVVGNNDVGTFKKILNLENSGETLSQYYVHEHKLITNPNDYTLDSAGFQEGIYKKRGRVFNARKTPDNVTKTVIREDFPSYLWNCNVDIDRELYYDNLNRPVGDFYLTIFATNRNLVWDFLSAPNFSPAGYGWDWNFRHDGNVDPAIDNATNPTRLIQNGLLGINLPIKGDIFRGAFVEYNPYELQEYSISEIGHTLKFNTDAMMEVGNYGGTVLSKYKYQPHYKIPVRKFSNTIDSNIDFKTSPQYAKYLQSEATHRWRPILPVGFYEELGDFKKLGVSYPYLNDAHYPYLGIKFMIEPLLHGYSAGTLNFIQQFGDVCE
ncbi:hypothetical protein N9322_00230 [bacterium]|nr:hypothetical protein [bacterium]|tara:strand:+ start:2615 stop:4405 length:1791 start_codon:yes stop_codon:yes gene_type:complete